MASRLLVIDDSQTIRKLVELACRSLPFALDYATNGAEGLAKARACPPDLVLLDLVLPDMRGQDVCRELSADPRTSRSTVLLMSAKDEATVRAELDGRAQGFLKKPFTTKELVTRLDEAVSARPSATPLGSKRPALPFEDKERLARRLYGQLKHSFARIPEWMAQLGSAPAATFFARRILTPELIDSLLEAVGEELSPAPITPAPQSSSASASTSPAERVPLSGVLDGFPVLDLFRAIAAQRRTGVLELESPRRRVWLWWRRGALLQVTTDAVSDYLAGAEDSLGEVPADALARASEEQGRSGKPVFVGLAESGAFPAERLARVLLTQGKRVLLETLDETRLSFGWKETPALPLYVEAQGREISFAQLGLERLRRRPGPPSTEDGAASLDSVFERVPGFSRHVRLLELLPEERRVLTLIDGRQPLGRVARRSSMSAALVSAVVSRLSEIELVRRVDARPQAGRRVVLIEPDADGVQRPLERLLARQREPAELVALSPDEPGLIPRVVRCGATMVIANASVLGNTAHTLARELVAAPQGLETSLVAVLEERDPEAMELLLASGFDAVLPKPVWFGDLDQMLNG